MRRELPLYDEMLAGDKVRNKYKFILAVAKRARMIVDGAPTAEGVKGAKPATKALGELLEGKIHSKVGAEETSR